MSLRPTNNQGSGSDQNGRLPIAQFNQRARAEVEQLEQQFGASCEVPLPPAVLREEATRRAASLPAVAKGHSPAIREFRPGSVAFGVLYGGPQPWWMK